MTCRVTGLRGRFKVSFTKPLRVIVLAASSDIGGHLVEHYLRQGAEVVGTYRNRTPRVTELEKAGARLFPVDITSGDQVVSFGGVTKSLVTASLANVAGVVRDNENGSIKVVIRREGRTQDTVLVLRPQSWSGRGLLGCHLQPV